MEKQTITIWKTSALGETGLFCTRCSECGIVLPGTAKFTDVTVTTFCPRCQKTVMSNKWPQMPPNA